MKTVGASVWKWMFVERPPMSQRSHIAHRGSSAISECSAACNDPSRRGSRSIPSSIHGSGRNQTASVPNSVSGRSTATSSMLSCVWIDFF